MNSQKLSRNYALYSEDLRQAHYIKELFYKVTDATS